jgi:tRNA1(Val) A37 N6-methylase TrmN6
MYTIGDLFDTTFKDYQHDEFFGKSGKEHYRLLSYFSSLHSNVHIIDIGTHMGNSALALSFNKTNTVHTFDIIKKDLNPYITSQTNITFHNDNIFEEKRKV